MLPPDGSSRGPDLPLGGGAAPGNDFFGVAEAMEPVLATVASVRVDGAKAQYEIDETVPMRAVRIIGFAFWAEHR